MRFDLRFMGVFVLSFCGIGISIFLARDLPMFQRGVVPRLVNSMASNASSASDIQAFGFIAAREIPANTKLSADMFRLATFAAGAIPHDVVRELSEIDGTFSRVSIGVETPIVRSAITQTQPQQEITSRIPAGYRAVAIPVNSLTGVEGWLTPGAIVDVVWSTQRGQQSVVSTIVENARVLSVERSLDAEAAHKVMPKQEPSHLTLLVSHEDAQKIQLAKGSGSLNLSLRGASDRESIGSTVLTAEALLTRRDPRSLIEGRVSMQGVDYVLFKKQLIRATEFEQKVAGQEFE